MLNYRKRKWMIDQHKKGVSVTDICKAQNVTRKVFYNLKDKYNEYGKHAFFTKSKGKPKEPIPKHIQDLVIKKKKETGFGVRKIEGVLDLEGIHIPHNKIHEILSEAGLVEHNPKKGRRYNYIRWERKHSNSLWQVDYCYVSRLECWLLAYLDDHSRFILGAEYFTEATTENATNCLTNAGKNIIFLGKH